MYVTYLKWIVKLVESDRLTSLTCHVNQSLAGRIKKIKFCGGVNLFNFTCINTKKILIFLNILDTKNK